MIKSRVRHNSDWTGWNCHGRDRLGNIDGIGFFFKGSHEVHLENSVSKSACTMYTNSCQMRDSQFGMLEGLSANIEHFEVMFLLSINSNQPQNVTALCGLAIATDCY